MSEYLNLCRRYKALKSLPQPNDPVEIWSAGDVLVEFFDQAGLFYIEGESADSDFGIHLLGVIEVPSVAVFPAGSVPIKGLFERPARKERFPEWFQELNSVPSVQTARFLIKRETLCSIVEANEARIAAFAAQIDALQAESAQIEALLSAE